MNQEDQRGILSVPFPELAKLLRLPEGHTIERVMLTEHPYAPGILVTVAGRAMPCSPPGSPLMVERYGAFIATAEARMEASMKQWPPTA